MGYVAKKDCRTVPVCLPSRLNSFWRLFFLLLLVVSCRTAPSTLNLKKTPGQERLSWESLQPGIEICFFKDDRTNSFCYGARIHIQEPGLQIFSTEPLENSDETKGETTDAFAKRVNASLAVNMSPYGLPGGYFSSRRKIIGLYLHDSTPITPPVARYGALLFMKNKSVQIIDSQHDSEHKDARFAFGGFWTILRENTVLPGPHKKPDSRTAAGVSSDGKTLFLLAVLKKGKNGGASFERTAEIMEILGADSALLMDGGGSTNMVVNGKSVLKGIISRKTGCNLGFKNNLN